MERGAKIGIGDELIASGQAKRAQLTDSRRVQILDVNGAARWHAIWEGSPRIVRPGEVGDFQRLANGPNCRPYIAGKTSLRWSWKAFECEPGEIFLSEQELDFARSYSPMVVIEPNIKKGASPNKQWGATRWRQFAGLATHAGYELSQLGAAGTRPLPGVRLIETPDFKRACAVLAKAKVYIGPDGGLTHAAAALNVPAIVIRGAFISERCTGYAGHRNLFTGRGLGCGMRVTCACCVAAMARITPEMVMEELKGVLNGQVAIPEGLERAEQGAVREVRL